MDLTFSKGINKENLLNSTKTRSNRTMDNTIKDGHFSFKPLESEQQKKHFINIKKVKHT